MGLRKYDLRRKTVSYQCLLTLLNLSSQQKLTDFHVIRANDLLPEDSNFFSLSICRVFLQEHFSTDNLVCFSARIYWIHLDNFPIDLKYDVNVWQVDSENEFTGINRFNRDTSKIQGTYAKVQT